MTKPEAAFLVSTLLAHYPGVRFDAGNAMAFEAGIIDLDASETREAVESLARTSEFMPVVAKVRAEVMRIRKARHEANAEQQRLLTARAPDLGPRAHEWGAKLPGMLEAQARFERMTKRFCEAKGIPYLGDPGERFVELCKEGASGKDVRGRFRREVMNDQDEQERRYP